MGFLKVEDVKPEIRKNYCLLTEREKVVLRLIASGLENKAIARKLFISIKTVETHKENLKEKLGLKSVRELYDML